MTAIRDRGSLAGAAAALDVVPSVVTKRLGALEARLGQRLFQRTTRRLSATAEGEAVCLHAPGPAARASRRSRTSSASGRTNWRARSGWPRPSASAGAGSGRRWRASRRAIPALQIQLQLTEQLPELGAEGYDGAVWLWPVQRRRAGDWVTRRIARNQRVLAAAPAYLERRGRPADARRAGGARLPGGARERRRGGERDAALWTLRSARDGSTARVRVRGPLASNSGELVRDWCLAGHGIMLRSLWDIAPQLASGELVRVLPQYAMPDADIHWVAPLAPQDAAPRARCWSTSWSKRFRGEPWKPAARRAR